MKGNLLILLFLTSFCVQECFMTLHRGNFSIDAMTKFILLCINKGNEDIIKTCVEYVIDNANNLESINEIWRDLLDVDRSDRLPIGKLKDMLHKDQTENSALVDNITCGSYLLENLIDEIVLESSTFKERVLRDLRADRNYFDNKGVNRDQFVTSYSSYYRDSPLRKRNIFTLLNKDRLY